jgi:hypothetical protein
VVVRPIVSVRAFLAIALFCCQNGIAQGPEAVWDTHEEVEQWVAILGDDGSSPPLTERLDEAGRTFVRIRWPEAGASVFPVIQRPTAMGDELGYRDFGDMPCLARPAEHNAIRLTLRNATGMDLVSGMYGQRGPQYSEDAGDLPAFRTYPLPPDGEWHEITMRFADSAFLIPEDDIVFFSFFLLDSRAKAAEDVEALYESLLPGTHLDVDKIELLSVAESIPEPQIADFEPKFARIDHDVEVLISGSGFDPDPWRNVVLFGSAEAAIAGGDEGTLRVRPRGPAGTTVQISVLTPGGRKASISTPFAFVGQPSDLALVSGDGQTALPGTTLEPFMVRVLDRAGSGVPGEGVSFRITEGEGSLSVDEALTDEDGLATTTLTLGQSMGEVKVEAAVFGLDSQEFRASAVQ